MKKNTKKETNIRVWDEDRLLLKEMANADGRTLRGQFKTVVNNYYKYRCNKERNEKTR